MFSALPLKADICHGVGLSQICTTRGSG
jgi:hypothetical protein